MNEINTIHLNIDVCLEIHTNHYQLPLCVRKQNIYITA